MHDVLYYFYSSKEVTNQNRRNVFRVTVEGGNSSRERMEQPLLQRRERFEGCYFHCTATFNSLTPKLRFNAEWILSFGIGVLSN